MAPTPVQEVSETMELKDGDDLMSATLRFAETQEPGGSVNIIAPRGGWMAG